MERSAIGVDLGGTKIEIARINPLGEKEEAVKVATDVAGGPSRVIDQIVSGIQSLSNDDSKGVGIGVAGQIDKEGRIIHFAPNLKWHEVPLGNEVEKRVGLPVVITNDVRAAAFGEWQHGEGKGVADFMAIYIGTGIGGGIVIDGKMVQGWTNTAGEVGHMTISLDGPPCTCGNQGCLEAFAGGWAIAKQAREGVESDPERGKRLLELAKDNLTTREVIQAYREGDSLATEVIERARMALSAGVAGLVNALNPQRVILGGGIVNGLPEIRDWVEEGCRERSLKAASNGLEVVLAKLKNEAGVIGAGSLAFQKSKLSDP